MLARLSRNMPPIDAPTSQLSGGQRQAIAIARAAAWGSKVIIMDEPTAALGPAETRAVEEVIAGLRDRGFAVLIISHNLEQVFRLADQIWVLRRGRMIGHRWLAETDPEEIVGMITGASAVVRGQGGDGVSATAASVTLSARLRALDYVRRYGIVVVFLALFVILAATLPQFRTAANLRNVLQQNSVIGIIACAMTFAIISGGFDLSVGAGAALASVVGAKLMIEAGIPARHRSAPCSPGCVGLLNGVLIAYAGVNPFVATLGTMTVVRGLVYVCTNATPFFGVPMSFTVVGLGRTGPLPNASWIFLAVASVLAFVLHQTRFGHYVYAIGGNIVAAAEMGINVRRVKLAVYALVGVCAAIAGIILTGQTATGQPQARSTTS